MCSDCHCEHIKCAKLVNAVTAAAFFYMFMRSLSLIGPAARGPGPCAESVSISGLDSSPAEADGGDTMGWEI
jgi:hypothetical protein